MTLECIGLIGETIETFVKQALPDAHEWEDSFRVVRHEGAYHVEADIPTSAMSCWLDFDVAKQGGRWVVTSLSAMRSGTGDDEDSVYVWDAQKRSWQLSRENEGAWM